MAVASVGPDRLRELLFAIANQTGDMRLEANLEFRFPFSEVAGCAFIDAGNVWNLQRASIDGVARDERGIFTAENFAKSIAANWGLGLRLDFDLLVRLDTGIKAYNPVTQKWHSPDMWFRKMVMQSISVSDILLIEIIIKNIKIDHE